MLTYMMERMLELLHLIEAMQGRVPRGLTFPFFCLREDLRVAVRKIKELQEQGAVVVVEENS